MADQFQRLIAELTDVQGIAQSDWGAENPLTRKSIRASIKQTLNCSEDISDLETAPQLKNWSTSVSHTKGFGGWVATQRPLRIGLDFEVADRIKTSTVERIATADEIAQAPDTRFLWCAKEALYKALEADQPVAVTQLTIGNWEPHGVFWRFKGKGPISNHGLVAVSGTIIISICVIPSPS